MEKIGERFSKELYRLNGSCSNAGRLHAPPTSRSAKDRSCWRQTQSHNFSDHEPARLTAKQGGATRRAMLAAIYGFTEGFDTKDVKTLRRSLDELS
jgi:hypothetical protein